MSGCTAPAAGVHCAVNHSRANDGGTDLRPGQVRLRLPPYELDRAHREPVYNTVARHLRGVAPCGTGLIFSGLAMADMLVEFDVDVVIPA